MSKGYQGEMCAESVRNAIERGEVLTASELLERVRQMGDWKDSTIWQHLMSCVVNLPSARHHWPWRDPFLFLREDGRYELYNPQVHPEVNG